MRKFQISIFISSLLLVGNLMAIGPQGPEDTGGQENNEPNYPPEVSNVLIGETAEIGRVIYGYYTFDDANKDADESIYKWYRADDSSGTNETEISGATSKSYTVTSSDEDKYLAFEVYPYDGEDFGDAVKSSYTEDMADYPKIDLTSVVVASKWSTISIPYDMNVSISDIPNNPMVLTFDSNTSSWEDVETLEGEKGYGYIQMI